MPFVPKDLTGRLFDNRADRRNKQQPDYAGTVNIRGVVYRIAGWYNPPSERSRVATIGLALEDYREYQARRDQASTDSSPPPPARPERVEHPSKPVQQDSFEEDDDIPF